MKNKSVQKDKKNDQCHYCGKTGHWKSECFSFKKDRANGTLKPKKPENNDVAVVKSDSELIVVGSDDVCYASTDQDWIIDSGASFHVTPHKNLFSSYSEGDYGEARMGNNGTSKIIAVGDVRLKSKTGQMLNLKNVRHIPDFRLNLISTGTLDDEGYFSLFGRGQWKLTKDDNVIARGTRDGNLYKSCFSKDSDVCLVENSINLWHKRLAHMSDKYLHILSKKNILPKFDDKQVGNCSHCIFGKQHRGAFNKTSVRKKSVLELVYSDVCGPMKVSTLGGCVYFVSFIDDYSRKLWTYAIKTKDQVFDCFKLFHKTVERETGKTLKCIRTDNGGEYIGKFDSYCKDNGIRHERSVPKSPQLNGVAERMNRTLIEKIRCMLSHANLTRSLWGEAMVSAVQVINLSPSSALNGEVPEKLWSGKDKSYNHLRVFGCKAFMHIQSDERSKLDSKSKVCIYLSAGDDKFGYKLYDPIHKKVMRSRDVVFMEDQTIKDIDPSVNEDINLDLTDWKSDNDQHSEGDHEHGDNDSSSDDDD